MKTVGKQFPLPPDFDYSKQSIEVPGTKRPGASAVYRHAAYPSLVDINTEGVPKTLVEIFENTLARQPDSPCFGARKLISSNPLEYDNSYTWITYRQAAQRRDHIGSALEFLWRTGRAGGSELPCVGIWSVNRPEWQLVDLAIQAYGKVSVSLHDVASEASVVFICNHSEVSIVFASASHISTLLKLKPQTKFLKIIVSLDELPEPALRLATVWAKQCGLEFVTLSQLEDLGESNPQNKIMPTSDQLYTICYTSGTTGFVKGTLLTNANIALAVATALGDLSFEYPGRCLSYLPLAHIFARTFELNMILNGIAIGYSTGDPLRLLEDAQILQPTVMPVVPRILQKLYVSAYSAADVPGFKGFLFRRAVAEKLKNLHSTGEVKHYVWDRLIFRKIQVVLGGKIGNMVCGSAPIAADCVDFIKIALACNFYEEIGSAASTETSCALTLSLTGDPSASGTVGPPQPLCEIKLVDVPSMGYTTDDKPNPRGELCARGGVVTQGYYKDPEATAQNIDTEGWLHTGDVAEIDSCGRFKFIDRLRNIQKLSQGEFVALDSVQNVYSAIPSISQIFVYGDFLQSYLVAVVVFEPEYLAKLVSDVLNVPVNDKRLVEIERAANDQRVKSVILEELTRHAKTVGLNGYEMVRDIHVTTTQFTNDNGTLTPTFKIKRHEAFKMYKKEIEKLYERSLGKSEKTKTSL